MIQFVEYPVILHNRHDENGEFYTPEFYSNNRCVEVLYRGVRDPEIVYMSPAKMRHYGVENDMARIEEKRGDANVLSHAFCSDYHTNMAKTILLRDFAVFYLNQLLERTIDSISTS